MSVIIKSNSLRPPEWADLPQLLDLGRLLHSEAWYSHIPFDENRVATFFYDIMLNRDKNFCRVATRGGGIIGAIAGSKVPYWFSRASGVFDSFLYVRPDERGGLVAYRLWRAMAAWSGQAGALELTHGVGTCSETADRFFAGIGMTHVGGIYKMRLAEQPEIRANTIRL
jgi:hypothetical protein